jgi:hypothetical protein
LRVGLCRAFFLDIRDLQKLGIRTFRARARKALRLF